jgi:hypothetical protein
MGNGPFKSEIEGEELQGNISFKFQRSPKILLLTTSALEKEALGECGVYRGRRTRSSMR